MKHVLEVVWPWVTLLNVCIYVITALLGGFLINTFEYALNSGQLGRGRWWAFECLWHEGILANIPGGLERKIQKLKIMAGPVSTRYTGSIAGWPHHELHANNSWEACARDVFESPFAFWARRIFLYFCIIGPFVGIVAFFYAVISGGVFIYIVAEGYYKSKHR